MWRGEEGRGASAGAGEQRQDRQCKVVKGGEQDESWDSLRVSDCVDPRSGHEWQCAEKGNAERSGDGHPQPGGRSVDVGEGAVGMLQEDAEKVYNVRDFVYEANYTRDKSIGIVLPQFKRT